jgi:hypothetical protein
MQHLMGVAACQLGLVCWSLTFHPAAADLQQQQRQQRTAAEPGSYPVAAFVAVVVAAAAAAAAARAAGVVAATAEAAVPQPASVAVLLPACLPAALFLGHQLMQALAAELQETCRRCTHSPCS